ncbi:hypothetical protein [Dactylosporangium sp. NPDC048998]|uniref:hypothetical protein n=1 Tax=Dactylosporangium sp. NPDC048998 TaxID=3363976 RepID=UPI003719D905
MNVIVGIEATRSRPWTFASYRARSAAASSASAPTGAGADAKAVDDEQAAFRAGGQRPGQVQVEGAPVRQAGERVGQRHPTIRKYATARVAATRSRAWIRGRTGARHTHCRSAGAARN